MEPFRCRAYLISTKVMASSATSLAHESLGASHCCAVALEHVGLPLMTYPYLVLTENKNTSKSGHVEGSLAARVDVRTTAESVVKGERIIESHYCTQAVQGSHSSLAADVPAGRSSPLNRAV